MIDICPCLNLPAATAPRSDKAVIVQIEQIVIGILVDAVFDVVSVLPEEMSGVPTAVHAIDNEYIRSVTTHGSAMMSILDLPKLLTQGDLDVDLAA